MRGLVFRYWVATLPSSLSAHPACSANVPVCSQGTNRHRTEAMNAFVVSGLTKRRAELAGDLERCHDSVRRVRFSPPSRMERRVKANPPYEVSHRYTALSIIAASAAATA